MQVIKKTISGIKWSVVVSILSTFSYLLINYILSNQDYDETLLGQFAAVVIAYNLIMTFVFWGGSNSIIFLYNRLDDEERMALLRNHFAALLSISTVAALIFLIAPNLLKGINEYFDLILLPAAFAIVMYYFISSIEMAKMNYFQGILLDKAHHFIFLGCTVIAWISMTFVTDSSFDLFDKYIIILTMFYAVIVCYKAKSLSFIFSKCTEPTAMKKQRFQYVVLTQTNTILAFLYMYLDQIILGQKLGVEQMGVYFLLFQIAMMVKYLTLQLNKTLFSSFSKVVSLDDYSALHDLYYLVLKYIILLCSLISVIVTSLGEEILSVFNEDYVEYKEILNLLVLANLVGALGSLNSMLITAKGKLMIFLCSNLLIGALNIGLLILVDENFFYNFGLIKIIVALSGQVILFSIAFRIVEFDLRFLKYFSILCLVAGFIYLSERISFGYEILLALTLTITIITNFARDRKYLSLHR